LAVVFDVVEASQTGGTETISSTAADLLWALRRGALIAIAIGSVLVLPWLVIGVVATLLNGGF